MTIRLGTDLFSNINKRATAKGRNIRRAGRKLLFMIQAILLLIPTWIPNALWATTA
jgi:hypothetical protein